jgi:hypothetical protein
LPADRLAITKEAFSRQLTSQQRATIRRHLALIPAYIWLIYILRVFGEQFPLTGSRDTQSVFRDFAHFYILGGIANARDAASLFSIDRQTAIMKATMPFALDTRFPPSYGPQVSLFFAPLARLPFVWAMTLWLALTMVLYALCVWRIWSVCPRLQDEKWPVATLAAGAPAFHFVLMYGQTSILALAAFGCAYLALRAGREFLAGVYIGLLAYKPQLGLAAAVVFVLAGYWRVVAGAICIIALQMFVAAVYWGPAVLVDYAYALARIPQTIALIEPGKQHLHSWRSLFQLLGLPATAVNWATIGASVVTLAGATVVWRSRRYSLAIRYSVLLFSTVLVSPHLFVYDLAVLVPALMLVWNQALDFERPRVSGHSNILAGLLILVYVSPLLEFLAPVIRVQISVLAIAVVQVLVTTLPHQTQANLINRSSRLREI